VADFLERHRDTVEEVRIAGGSLAVSEQVEAALADMGFEVERLSGEDRFETSAEIAERLFPDATTVVLATGGDFADALAGAAQAGRADAPVLLVGATLPESVREYLEERAGTIEVVYLLGGDAAVPDDVQNEVNAILGLE
jgi:putative cell wall-binding protein